MIDSDVFTLDIDSTTATKKITVQSSDAAKIGTHSMTVSVKYKDFVTPTTIAFDIIVVDPCLTDTLTIDPSVFLSPFFPVLTYDLRSGAKVFTFTNTAAISGSGLSSCGDLDWTILKKSDDSAIDSDLFTLDIASTSTTKKITVQSSDIAKVSTYGMTATVKYKDYSTVAPASINFDIVVDDPCSSAIITFDSVLPSTSVTYTIGANADVQTFAISKISHDIVGIICPAFTVELFDDKSDQTIHDSLATRSIFTYNSTSGELTTQTDDLTMAGTYAIRMKAKV